MPEPRREYILYIKKEWRQLSPLAQEDYISRGTHRDRVLDGTAYPSSSAPWRDVAEVCDEELAHIEAMHPRVSLIGSSSQIAFSAKDSALSPLVLESVWISDDGEYHRRLHEWLLTGWCYYDYKKKKFVWRHSLNDFGFVISKVNPCLGTDLRYDKLAREWLFEKLLRPPTAKQIRDAYHKIQRSGEYSPSPELNKVPLPQ
jgi:hypothetical protein